MALQSARFQRCGRVFAWLMAATALSSLLGSPVPAQEVQNKDATLLDTIVVKTKRTWTILGGKGQADAGTITLGQDAIALKADGSDANSALKNNPNVQSENDGSIDKGSDAQDLIDTKPALLSISGGKVSENNFMINGIGINTVTGTEEPFGSDNFGSFLTANESTPNINKVYGLHPQSIYVPSDFVEESKVIDSNASARYGEFLGGVVDYKLNSPSSEKAHGMVRFGFTSDELTKYNLETKTGTNPNAIQQPEYLRFKSAFEYNVPIHEGWSIIGQYSREQAKAQKQKTQRYDSLLVDDASRNETFRLASKNSTDFGDFTLDTTFTRYSATWDGMQFYDTIFDAQNRSQLSSLTWNADLDFLNNEAVGLKNVKAETRAYHSNARVVNESGGNDTYNWYLTARSSTSVTNPSSWFHTTDPAILAMCTENAADFISWATAITCRTGGYGEKSQGQKQSGFKSDIEGDIFAGTFASGLEYKYTDAFRRAEEYTLYSVAKTLANRAGGYSCPSGSTDCSSEQYFSTKTVTPAYNNRVQLNHFSTYAELDQTWGWLNLRTGGRLDYDDYLKNMNLAPRVVATVTPVEGYEFGIGYARYYSADSLAYAIRDGQPLGRAYSRTHDSAGNVGSWTGLSTQRYYAFNASGLDTPYKDEFTAGLKAEDPWAGGQFRLRFLERRGHDEFMSDSGGTSTNVTLTNDGESRYRSLTAEYEKSWDMQGAYLDSVSLTAKATWSKQKTTTVSAFMDDEENWYWYNSGSYSPGEFGLVTGNLNIPIRTSIDLATSWLDDRLKIGVETKINLPYQGVIDSGYDCTPSTSSSTCPLPAGSEGIGKEHSIFEDHKFGTTLTFDLKTSYQVAKKDDNTFEIEFNVLNLLNDTGNGYSQISNPWVVGRTVWVGAKATF